MPTDVTVTPAATQPSLDPQPVDQAPAPLPPVLTNAPPADHRSQANQPQVAAHAPPRNQRYEKKPLPKPSKTGLDPILLLVANRPFHDYSRPNPSTYIPCLIMFFAVLHRLDSVIYRTYRFYQTSPQWSPTMSQYFFTVCLVYHILRAIDAAGQLSQPEADLLDLLERRIAPQDLFIPGPLVPFFRAICSFYAPDSEIGVIHPALPALTNMSEAGHYLYGNGLDFVFPNPVTLLDQMMRISNADPAGIAHLTDRRHTQSVICNIPAAANANNLPAACGPYFHQKIIFSAANFANLTEAMEEISLPSAEFDAAGQSAVPISWARALGLEDHNQRTLGTFSQVSGVMARYAQFFKNSATLADVAESGIAAAAVVVTHSANAHLFAAPNLTQLAAGPPPTHYYTFEKVADYPIGGNHGYEDLDELAEQYGEFTAINASFTGRNHPSLALPTDAQLRAGPFWSFRTLRRVRNVDVLGGVDANIAAHYSFDARHVV